MQFISWKMELSLTINAKLNGTTIRLGGFNLEEDAAKAYNEFAKKHYGEFANLNIL